MASGRALAPVGDALRAYRTAKGIRARATAAGTVAAGRWRSGEWRQRCALHHVTRDPADAGHASAIYDRCRGVFGHAGRETGCRDTLARPVSYTHLTLPTSDLV